MRQSISKESEMFARTERLLLRPSWPEDGQALYEAIADEAIVRNLSLAPWPYTPRDADEFTAREHNMHFPNFLLWQRTDGAPRLIGACGLGNREGAAELGYWIARPYWGLGYASEATRAVVGVARALGHRHLVSGHFTDNLASGRVLRKAGFLATGITEMRHSKGRGTAIPCALYERSLDDDVGSNDIAPVRMFSMLPYDAELVAA
jgi:RimJ/RimL family protein N-acetyltransferase